MLFFVEDTGCFLRKRIRFCICDEGDRLCYEQITKKMTEKNMKGSEEAGISQTEES